MANLLVFERMAMVVVFVPLNSGGSKPLSSCDCTCVNRGNQIRESFTDLVGIEHGSFLTCL